MTPATVLMAATASQTNLAGLPRRLVQDGIVSADALAEASEAAKKEKVTLVAYLVNEELAEPRAIAVAAAHEFGGRFRQERYQKRPFMGPALERIRPRLARMWAGTLR